MARDRGPSGPSGRCRSRTRPARPAGRAGDGGLRWSSARASGHASRRRSGPCAEALRCPRSAMAVERRDGPMGLLEGKRALIFGVANDHSIAWGIAQAFHREGATIGLSSVESLIEKRGRPLAASIGSTFVEPCDVQDDAQVARVFDRWRAEQGQLDILVHALAFARRDDLDGAFVDTSRDGFALALDVSAYSLVALTRAALPLMSAGASVLTLTYYGAEKVVSHYNVMGVAKAALAASGVAGFKGLYGEFRDTAPLRRNITIEDVGGAAVYLSSDLAAGVTGEVHYVDAGFNVLAVPTRE